MSEKEKKVTKKSINIFVPIEDYDFVRDLATRECRTMSSQVAYIINKYRQQQKQKAVDSLRQPYNE